VSGNYFCNYAVNTCQEGITPFADPIMTCPVPGNMDLSRALFVQDEAYYNAICWIIPAYKCAKKVPRPSTTAALEACIESLVTDGMLQGPHLCRDYCSPDAFNVDNKLYAKNSDAGCACAIGWNVGMSQPFPNYINPSVTGRRLFADDAADNSTLIAGGLAGGLAGSLAGGLACDSNASFLFANRDLYAERLRNLGHYFTDDWTHNTWATQFVALPSTSDGSTACYDNRDCENAAAICRGPTPFQKKTAHLGAPAAPCATFLSGTPPATSV
jgi:hypothetical protein